MALHPQAQAALDIVAGAGIPAVEELTPQQAREAFRKSVALCGAPGEPVARVEERAVEGAAGSIPVRVYGPDAPAPRPVLVYFHGGGWVVGDLDTVDSPLRALANRSGATIVSVDYRLAPEHPYPAALEDCFAATEWAAAHAGDIGGARGRVAIGGDSAGGNLALAVALAARAGGAPDIGYQVLLYPVADHDFATTSYRDNAEGYGLTRAGMKWYWDHYVRDPQLRDDPLVSPLRAKDLSRLPPALVVTAEHDPLRHEGAALAARMLESGVSVEHLHYDGMIHGFWRMNGLVDAADGLTTEIAARLKRALPD